MWKPAIRAGVVLATLIMAIIAVIGLISSLFLQTFIFGYLVGILTFLGTGLLLLLGGCLFSRQPLDNETRYDIDGTPVPSWRRALLGLRLMMTSIFLFLYGVVFTFLSLFLGI